eukprot:2670585-Pyramimonas_sp.AAC.1
MDEQSENADAAQGRSSTADILGDLVYAYQEAMVAAKACKHYHNDQTRLMEMSSGSINDAKEVIMEKGGVR